MESNNVVFEFPTGTNSLGRMKKRRIHHHNDLSGLVDSNHQGLDAMRVVRRRRGHKRQVRTV